MFSLVCTAHALVLLLCACATYRARAGSQQRGALSVGENAVIFAEICPAPGEEGSFQREYPVEYSSVLCGMKRSCSCMFLTRTETSSG